MKSNKKIYLIILSIISAFAVVLMHTNGVFWHFSKENYWLISCIIRCLCSFAVPCFFMITGANLLDYQERYSTIDYFKKRIKKTVFPFIAWSIIGILFMCFYEKSLSIHNLGIRTIVNGIINSKFITIYWFFIALFGIYLIIPIFSSIEKEKKLRTFKYLIIVGIVFNFLIPYLNYIFKLGIEYKFTIPLLNDYVLCLLIGYVLDKEELSIKRRITIYFIGLLSIFVITYNTYNISIISNSINWLYLSPDNFPFVLFYSTFIFLLVKDLCKKIRINKLEKSILFLGNYTFSIYLVHWYVMKFLRYTFNWSEYSLLYILLCPFLIISISVLITYFLKKIPIIKKIVP